MFRSQYFFLYLLLILISFQTNRIIGQENNSFLRAEILGGFTAASNKFFPDRSLQKQLTINYVENTYGNTAEWIYWLNAPRRGFSLGYTDLGNSQELGSIYTAMPFLEFQSFKSTRWYTQLGLGVSYFTRQFDRETNVFNRAVSTDFTWSARLFMHYIILQKPAVQFRIGAGLVHHSNGHTRLPNQGYNSFLLSLSTDFKPPENKLNRSYLTKPERSRSDYMSIRAGVGQNVLGDAYPFNTKKEVYSMSAEYGKVFNKTIKVGIGSFYRLYEHYYDYINDNEFFVRDGQEFSNLRESPWHNASNFGLFTKGEILLNHVGIELLIGVNLHKPAYKIDWRINEGWDYTPREPPANWIFGEFGSKYKFKELLTSRLGIKYYLLGTETIPRHNVFIGAFIKANLGQADFTEIGIGYVYNWNFKRRT